MKKKKERLDPMKYIIQKVSEFGDRTLFKVKHEDFDFILHTSVGNVLVNDHEALYLYLKLSYSNALFDSIETKLKEDGINGTEN